MDANNFIFGKLFFCDRIRYGLRKELLFDVGRNTHRLDAFNIAGSRAIGHPVKHMNDLLRFGKLVLSSHCNGSYSEQQRDRQTDEKGGVTVQTTIRTTFSNHGCPPRGYARKKVSDANHPIKMIGNSTMIDKLCLLFGGAALGRYALLADSPCPSCLSVRGERRKAASFVGMSRILFGQPNFFA